jgi:hypothetical protein
MQGIYYLLSIVAVFIVFVWYIRNEGLDEGEPTRGLLAMKEPAPLTPDRAANRRNRANQIPKRGQDGNRPFKLKR